MCGRGWGVCSLQPAERMLVAQHFRDIVKRANLASTASAIDVTAWDDGRKGDVSDFLGPASEMCFENCLQRLQDYLFDQADGAIAVMFDQGINNSRLRKRIDFYKQIVDSRVEFRSITFGEVSKFCQLQAADIVATQNYWIAQNWLGIRPDGKDPDVAFRRSFDDKPFEGLILDRSAIASEIEP